MQTSILRSLAIAFTATIVFLAANSLSATEPTNPPTATTPTPHCQVPCGIYTDQLRFEQMLEDTKTIAKSITSVETIAQAMKNGEHSPTNFNQMTRWINTKEDHASKIQKTIADYFLTQRIKESNKALLGRQELELNKDEPATTIRSITAQGKTWLAVFSVMGQRVHVLDPQLKQLAVLPRQGVLPEQAEQTGRIIDVQFYAQPNQPPQLLVAWQDAGVESYDLITNDSMTVSKVRCESLGAVGSVLAGVANGRAQTMAGDRHASQDGIQFVRLSASDSQLLGVGQTSQGKWSAIGLDEKMAQVWAIETGPQLHENFVSPIANAKLTSGQTIWAIADSNRMVHLISGSGQWLGEFEAEGEVSGLCLQLVGGKMLMAISTTAGVECWDLGL